MRRSWVVIGWMCIMPDMSGGAPDLESAGAGTARHRLRHPWSPAFRLQVV
jgi:hypothetical protein